MADHCDESASGSDDVAEAMESIGDETDAVGLTPDDYRHAGTGARAVAALLRALAGEAPT